MTAIEYIKEAARSLPARFSLVIVPMGVCVEWRSYDGLNDYHHIVHWVEIETCRVNPIIRAIDEVRRRVG